MTALPTHLGTSGQEFLLRKEGCFLFFLPPTIAYWIVHEEVGF